MFKKARITLTAWYLIIIMIISLTLSGLIYRIQISEISRLDKRWQVQFEQDFNGRVRPYPQIYYLSPEFFEESNKRVLVFLINLNLGIFVISAALGYLLAGRTLKPIQDMVDDQNRFVGDASHEFKTPLTSLKSAFEVYLRSKNPDDKKTKLLIKESIVEVDKLQKITEKLLDLSHLKSTMESYTFKTLNLRNVLEESTKKASGLAGKKNIRVLANIVDVKVKGIENNLVQLFVILLDNAIKYSAENTEVVISNKIFLKTVEVTVRDRGIGIPKDDVSKIFDRFYQTDKARSKNSENGYGLGLSIAQEIAKIHGGEIKVKSNLGVGSEFIVKLPL